MSSTVPRSLSVLSIAVLLTAAAVGTATAHPDHPKPRTAPAASEHVPNERLSDEPCVGGQAGPFACSGVDLLSFVPYEEFVGFEPTLFPGVSDLWGWTDQETGDEYVIVGKSNGVSFLRVTDPTDPVYLGDLPSTSPVQLVWYDIKVFADHAFIVSESAPANMRVFDLTRLREAEEAQSWDEDARYLLNFSAHNIAINEATGFAYIVGGNEGIVVPDQCDSGLHMVDINEPTSPSFAGCWTEDSYVHDTQCVIYEGLDREHQGKELCFSSNEDTVSIVDVTDKDNPQRISEPLTYEDTSYTHQGWLTEDQRFFVFGDEGDEQDFGLPTRTLIVDVTDLDNPKLIGEHLAETASIDHNQYIKGRLLYQSNYTAGLRVLDTKKIRKGELEEVAFFDTYPDHDDAEFVGTWSNYPFFESGTIAVSGIDEGLFLVRLQRPGQGKATVVKPAPEPRIKAASTLPTTLPTTGGGMVALGLLFGVSAGMLRRRLHR